MVKPRSKEKLTSSPDSISTHPPALPVPDFDADDDFDENISGTTILKVRTNKNKRTKAQACGLFQLITPAAMY